MKPVLLCILRFKQFEETFEKTQWRKIDQADAFHRIYDILVSIQYLITVYPAQPYTSLCYWGADEIDEKYRKLAFMTMMTMPAEGNGSC